jgi:hypothetical protein
MRLDGMGGTEKLSDFVPEDNIFDVMFAKKNTYRFM